MSLSIASMRTANERTMQLLEKGIDSPENGWEEFFLCIMRDL